MNFRRLALSLCFVCVATLARDAAAQFAAPGADAAAGLAAVDGLLLLKNGETLAGSISRSGDYYLVVTQQSELQIRVRDAEAICRDLEEVFSRKRALRNMRSADDHLELAQWCIDRELFGHAARELTEAYRIDDTHPRIRLLELRLKAAMATPSAPPAPPKPIVHAVGDDELNRVAASVGADGLQEFTVRVQPLLMNYCATAGCHGPRSQSNFHLERVYLNEPSDLRTVKLNLMETLKQVDRQSPSTSKLLTVPISPHGGGKKPVFHVHNAEHYRTMANWVGRISNNARSAPPATTSNVGASSELSQRLPLVAPTTNVDAPAAATAPATPPAAANQDPFDPAEFNAGNAAP